MNKNLESITARLNSIRIKLADEKFGDMTISQLVEYAATNPNCKIFQDYILNCCSPSRTEEFIKRAELYEKIK